jgi:hypothetical protein
MKKLVPMLLVVLLFSGCTLFNMGNTPTSKTEALLKKYQSLDTAVVSQLDDVVNSDDTLSTSQKDEYKRIIKNQYQNITYSIKDEAVDGDNATVKVEIEVYDLDDAIDKANDYLNTNATEFDDTDGKFSQTKFNDYKLNLMSDQKTKIKYTIDFALTKTDKTWTVNDLTETERQKIHGIYNYD